MRILDITGKLILSESNIITMNKPDGTTEELTVDELLEALKDGKYYYTCVDLAFKPESCNFIITKRKKNGTNYTVPLELAGIHMDLLKQGKIDSSVKKLLDYAEKSQFEKKRKAIYEEVLKTGKNPTDPESLLIYKDYLTEQLKDTNAYINSATSILLRPLFSIPVSLLSVYGSLISESNTAAAVAFGIGIISFFLTFNALEHFSEARECRTEKIRQKKLLEAKLDSLNNIDAISLSSVQEGLENQEVKSMANNNNIFLQELEEVKKKIARLPEEERNSYINELVEIVRSYDLKITAILDRNDNKIVLGDAANLWSVTASMLPDLYDLGGRIDQRLAIIKEKKEIKCSLSQLEESVKALNTNKGYTDGWTDGYTDDLTSGGVAYATQSSGQRRLG